MTSIENKSSYTLEDVLTNLKIISNVNINDKLTLVNNILVIDPPQYIQGIIRWWRSDSRENSMNGIEEIISNVFNIIDNIYNDEVNEINSEGMPNFYHKRDLPKNYFKNEHSLQLQTFTNELTNSIKGLQNLKITYQTDISICSKIDVLIDKINIRINKINKLLTINYENFNPLKISNTKK